MEIVNTLDIDGTQWEITDNQARQDIAILKSNQENVLLGRVEMSLKPGFTATDAKLLGVYKMGKLVFGTIRITSLAGEWGEITNVIDIAEFPYKPTSYIECVAVDMDENNAYRMQIFPDKHVTIASPGKLKNGVNDLTANFIFFEE